MREDKSRVVEMVLPKRKVASKNEVARAVPRDAKSFQFRPRPSSEVLGESAPSNFDSHTLPPTLGSCNDHSMINAKMPRDPGRNGTARPGMVSYEISRGTRSNH